MDSNVELQTVPVRKALVVHARCPMSAVGTTVGPIFGEVAAWAGSHHLSIAGPAIARYTVMERGECEVDAGFVIASSPNDTDQRVHVMELGGGTAAHATHVGSYESLAETYGAIERWMQEYGYVSAGPMWEEYFSPPGTPVEETRTSVYWPVRKE